MRSLVVLCLCLLPVSAGAQSPTFNALTVTGNAAVGSVNTLAVKGVGTQSIAIGTGALAAMTTDQCVALGWHALNQFQLGNTVPCGNTAIGQQALAALVQGQESTAVGQFALANSTASGNTAVGQGVMQNATTAANSAAFGWGTEYNMLTGNYNAAFGYAALFTGTAATGNAAFGHDALYGATGNYNVAVGFKAGFNATGSTGDVYLGCWGTGTEPNDAIYLCDGENHQRLSITPTLAQWATGMLVQADTIKFTPGTLPVSPTEGQCAWDVSVHKLKCYDGTIWQSAW